MTVFLVTSFIVVLISLTELTPLFFLQMSQLSGGDIDIVLTKKIDPRSVYTRGNRNFYGQDPFGRTKSNVWTSNYEVENEESTESTPSL